MAPQLKNWFNRDLFEWLATEIETYAPEFEGARFVTESMLGLDGRELMDRLRHTTGLVHSCLNRSYRAQIEVLKLLAPTIENGFVGMFLPDFVNTYGLDDVEFSIAALEFFTCYSSSEFAIRYFLRQHYGDTMAVMVRWSQSDNEHVRRLSCEGCRPRLPWSFRLQRLIDDPTPVRPILENLRADPALYVRKSVANHLNDISKDHPDWMLDLIDDWDRSDPYTAWIAKRACRTLIKKGEPRAFKIFGFESHPRLSASLSKPTPSTLKIGDELSFAVTLRSTASHVQKLAVDYRVHYVKKNGSSSAKVFKLRELELAPGQSITIEKRHSFQERSTRKHYPGLHQIELMVNGSQRGLVEVRLTTP